MAQTLFIVCASLIALLHLLSVFLKKKIAEILIFVNLGLHTVFVFILLWLKASIEFFALSFMISLLIYLLFSLVRYKVFCGREEKP